MKLVAQGAKSGNLTVSADAGRGTQMVTFRRVGTLPLCVITGISLTAMLRNWARFVGVLAAISTACLVYVSRVAIRKTRREATVAVELQEQIRARAGVEQRMLEAQRLETLSFVTGSVAHDFNNMLAVITSSLHVHKMRHPDAAKDKTLAAISRSVQAGVRLTRQLLSFSKKQALRPETVTFQTWLPSADEVAPAPVTRLEARLLLVEDNDDVGKTTEQLLRSAGLTVVRVASADAALEHLATASTPPEIVLSDIAMPGSMNGIGLALELQRRHANLPVLLHTGYAEQIDEATAAGMRVFQKPVPPEILLAELKALLSKETGLRAVSDFQCFSAFKGRSRFSQCKRLSQRAST